jgi:hypothetical protein
MQAKISRTPKRGYYHEPVIIRDGVEANAATGFRRYSSHAVGQDIDRAMDGPILPVPAAETAFTVIRPPACRDAKAGSLTDRRLR